MNFKNLLLITGFTFIILLITSCSKTKKDNTPINNGESFYLESEYYNCTEENLLMVEDYEYIKNLEKNKKSFAIFVYLPGCLSSLNFEKILDEYLQKNKIKIYSISFSNIKGVKNTITKTIEYAPSVLIFKEGKLAGYLNTTNDQQKQYFKSVQAFNQWFTSYVDIPE